MDTKDTLMILAGAAALFGSIGGGLGYLIRLLWDSKSSKLERLAKRADTLEKMADENEQLTNDVRELRRARLESDDKLDELQAQNKAQQSKLDQLEGAWDYAAQLDACFASVESDVTAADTLVEIGHAARPSIDAIKTKIGGRPRRSTTNGVSSSTSKGKAKEDVDNQSVN